MFRTLPKAGAIVVLAALLGDSPLHAAPAATNSDQPYAIVAQSTSATAATGRRPIGKRIVASNLPVRPAPPPPLPKCPDEVALTKTVVTAPIPADPPLPAESAPAMNAESEVDAESPVTSTVQTAVPAESLAAVPAAPDVDPTPEPAATVELVHAPDVASAATEAAEAFRVPAVQMSAPTSSEQARLPAITPVPLSHARPPLPPAARENLLKRIKTAFGVPQRNGRPAPITAAAEPRAELIVPDSAPSSVPVPATAEPAAAMDPPVAQPAALTAAAAGEPARLEFDVRESRALMGEGEQVVMRIAVRNIGGETAERVTATLFFAEGIEPVQAIGQAAEVYPGEVRFETVPELSPGDSVDLLVTAVGTRPGSVAYRGEIECREPAGRVAREGTVTIRARQAAAP